MENLSQISTIKTILEKHGFSFSKALGQNFLINPSVSPRMAEMSGADENTGVIEIGPGIGVLSVELAKISKKVISIEIDKRLIPILSETLKDFDNIQVINSDILKLDLSKLIEDNFKGMDIVVCANLPYYITTPIIMKLLEERLPIKSITVMVQKETAQRLCAEAGTREVGAVTIGLRYYSNPEILFNVSRESFMPSPDVDSSVIKLNVHDNPPINVLDEKFFFRLVKSCFSKRRKTITNCITSDFNISKQELTELLEQCGLSKSIRAEQLTMKDFEVISNTLYSKLK